MIPRNPNWKNQCPYCASDNIVKDDVSHAVPPMIHVTCCDCKRIDWRSYRASNSTDFNWEDITIHEEKLNQQRRKLQAVGSDAD